MGYDSKALEALNAFYSGEYFNLDENARAETEYPDLRAMDHVSLLNYHLQFLTYCSRTRICSQKTQPCGPSTQCQLYYNVYPSENW